MHSPSVILRTARERPAYRAARFGGIGRREEPATAPSLFGAA